MPINAIKIETKINRSPIDTFDMFMSKVSDWWPLDTHSVSPSLGEPAPETVVIERFEGGKVFEIATNGQHRIWGTILEYAEGKRVAFTWHPGLSADDATEVSVAFERTDDGNTLVTLTHKGWEVRGEQAADIRGNYVKGWTDIIQKRFAGLANAR